MAGLIGDIWRSFMRLPVWVRVWVALILVPVNLLPLLFPGAPNAGWIAALSVGGMAINTVIMLYERGLSRAMALPHLVLWTPLVILLIWMLASGGASGGYEKMLMALLAVDLVSLGFDFPDALRWRAGERDVA